MLVAFTYCILEAQLLVLFALAKFAQTLQAVMLLGEGEAEPEEAVQFRFLRAIVTDG